MSRPTASGDRLSISAREWNALRRDVERVLRNLKPPVPIIGHGKYWGVVPIVNYSDADRDAWDVLGYSTDGSGVEGTPHIRPQDNEAEFKRQPLFRATKPSRPTHLGRFGVLPRPVKRFEIGSMIIAGVCPVKLKYESDRYIYRFRADVLTSDASRLGGHVAGGADILWVQETEADVDPWALVRIGDFYNPSPLVMRRAADVGGDPNWMLLRTNAYGGSAYSDTSIFYTVNDGVSPGAAEGDIRLVVFNRLNDGFTTIAKAFE